MSEIRITWTTSEQQAIARRTLHQIRNVLDAQSWMDIGPAQITTFLSRRGFFANTFPEMQCDIDPTRRRKIAQLQMVKWLPGTMLAELRLLAQQEVQHLSQLAEEQRVAEEQKAKQDITFPLTFPAEAIQALAAALAPLVAVEVAKLLNASNPEKPMFASPALTTSTPVPREPKLPKVLVYGLLPVQQHELESKWKNKFRFVFLKECTTAQIKAQKACDYAIRLTTKMSHAANDALSACFPGSRSLYANGGPTSIGRVLQGLATKLGQQTRSDCHA